MVLPGDGGAGEGKDGGVRGGGAETSGGRRKQAWFCKMASSDRGRLLGRGGGGGKGSG